MRHLYVLFLVIKNIITLLLRDVPSQTMTKSGIEPTLHLQVTIYQCVFSNWHGMNTLVIKMTFTLSLQLTHEGVGDLNWDHTISSTNLVPWQVMKMKLFIMGIHFVFNPWNWFMKTIFRRDWYHDTLELPFYITKYNQSVCHWFSCQKVISITHK